MPNPFDKINEALRGRRAGEGVQRVKPKLDEELRKKREAERIARARAQRLKDLGITDTTVK